MANRAASSIPSSPIARRSESTGGVGLVCAGASVDGTTACSAGTGAGTGTDAGGCATVGASSPANDGLPVLMVGRHLMWFDDALRSRISVAHSNLRACEGGIDTCRRRLPQQRKYKGVLSGKSLFR